MCILITTRAIDSADLTCNYSEILLDYYELIKKYPDNFDFIIDSERIRSFSFEGYNYSSKKAAEDMDLYELHKELSEEGFRRFVNHCLKAQYKYLYRSKFNSNIYFFSTLPAKIEGKFQIAILDKILDVIQSENTNDLSLLLHKSDWYRNNLLDNKKNCRGVKEIVFFSHEPTNEYFKMVVKELLNGNIDKGLANFSIIPRMKKAIITREKLLFGIEEENLKIDLEDLNKIILKDLNLGAAENLKNWIQSCHI